MSKKTLNDDWRRGQRRVQNTTMLNVNTILGHLDDTCIVFALVIHLNNFFTTIFATTRYTHLLRAPLVIDSSWLFSINYHRYHCNNHHQL